MLCVLVCALSIGFAACNTENNSKDSNKKPSTSQNYDDEEDDLYTDNY